MIWLYITLGVLALLLFIYIFLLIYVGIWIFHSPNKQQLRDGDYPSDPEWRRALESVMNLLEALRNEPCEDIYINSFDNKKLHARYFHYHDNAKTAILFHGYRGTANRDFSGGFFMCKELGYNILLVDERAHPLSKGYFTTMSVKESRDVKSWSEYIVNRFPNTDIILVGISMGASSVIASLEHHLSDNVKAILADCPFSSPKEIVCKVCKEDTKVPLWIGWPALFLSALLVCHFNLLKADNRKIVKNTNIPILIIHGEADNFVPAKMSEEIYLSNPSMIKRYTFPNAGHGLSYIADRERYKSVTRDFLNDVFKTN